MRVPVLYLLDEYGEAQHTRRFCSVDCRAKWKPHHFEVEVYGFALGIEHDVGVEGECCETCGLTIQDPKASGDRRIYAKT